MPQVITPKRVSRNLMAYLAVSGLLLVLVIGVGVWAWWMAQPKPKVLTAQELSDQTVTMTFRGDYAGALALIKSQFELAKTKEDKYRLAMGVGTTYEAMKDCTNAIAWFKKAETYSTRAKDRPTASGLARCYEDTGNKPEAAKYYQIVLDTIDHSKYGWEAEVAWYNAALKRVSE